MSARSFLLFGAGYSLRAFAASLPAERFAGTTRAAARFDLLRGAGIEPLAFDGSGVSAELRSEIAGATDIVVSAAPDDEGDPVLRAGIGELLADAGKLRWIGYLSTVGVYGDHGGAWVDEETECRPVSRRSQRRLDAERAWLELGRRLDVPVAVLRLSGIYGPGRNAFINLRNGSARRLVKPGQVFNRIHVADIAGALAHLSGERRGGVFNVTDDLPSPPQDVVALAAELMGVSPPPETPFEAAELSPMARSFYAENKRVSNRRLREAGYRFVHPDYRVALATMWRDGSWEDASGG